MWIRTATLPSLSARIAVHDIILKFSHEQFIYKIH